MRSKTGPQEEAVTQCEGRGTLSQLRGSGKHQGQLSLVGSQLSAGSPEKAVRIVNTRAIVILV